MDSIIALHITLTNDFCNSLMGSMAKGQTEAKSYKQGHWDKCQCVGLFCFLTFDIYYKAEHLTGQ